MSLIRAFKLNRLGICLLPFFLVGCGVAPEDKYFLNGGETIYPSDQVEYTNRLSHYAEAVTSKKGVSRDLDEAALDFYESFKDEIPSLVDPSETYDYDGGWGESGVDRKLTNQFTREGSKFASNSFARMESYPLIETAKSVTKWICIYRGNNWCKVYLDNKTTPIWVLLIGENDRNPRAEVNGYSTEIDLIYVSQRNTSKLYDGFYPGDVLEFDGELSFFTYRSDLKSNWLEALVFQSMSNVQMVSNSDNIEVLRDNGWTTIEVKEK